MLFLGHGLAGWLLNAYSASVGIWLLTEAIVLYLAWSGTGAIALSSVGVMGIISAATLFTPCPSGMLSIEMHLTAAQGWAVALVLSWLLAMGLVFKLAFAKQQLNAVGLSRAQAFWLLVIITNVGLRLGQLIEIKLLHN